MPFLRFSRDKRGYEHIYLVHTSNRRGKPSRPRVLYWYRTPPGIRVGRPPFDEEVRRRLESQNPDVVFDWPAIIATPMPPPAEHEQWRERRRAERAAKHAQRAEDEAAAASNREAPAEMPQSDQPDEFLAYGAKSSSSLIDSGNESAIESPSTEARVTPQLDPPAETSVGSSETGAASAPSPDQAADTAARRRRRRGGRRRRGRRQGDQAASQGAIEGGNPVVPTDSQSGSDEPWSESESVESIESNDE